MTIKGETEASEQPNLADLLTEETVLVKVLASHWEDAIKKAGELLVNIGAVETRYIPAMIRFCKEYGPYVVIAPGIAIPHARPEDGVKQTCFSLVTLEKGVNFGSQNDPVDLIIAFGATSDKDHLRALAQLAEILSNEEKLKNVRNAKTKKETLEIIHATNRNRRSLAT